MATKEEIQAAQQKLRAEMRDRVEGIARALTTEDGHRTMRYLRGFCYAEKTTVSRPTIESPIDPYETILNEGKRMVYEHLRGIIELAKQPPPTLPTQAISASAEHKES